MLEQESLEWNHAEVATWICSEWGLPENIAIAIRNHHSLEVDHDHKSHGPVRLVSILREDESNPGLDEMIAAAEEIYNISEEKVKPIVEPAFQKAEDLARIIV